MIRNKTIKFDLDKQEDREIWEYLSTLPHGEFTDSVKAYFTEQMETAKYYQERKTNNNPAALGLSLNDPVVNEALLKMGQQLKEEMEKPLPPDSPWNKHFN